MNEANHNHVDSATVPLEKSELFIGVKDVAIARYRSSLFMSDGGGTGGGDSNDTGN